MSQKNLELWRASIEETFFPPDTERFDPDVAISKMAELWDREVTLDATEADALDLKGIYRGTDEARRFWQAWLSAWETLRFDYELIDAGERVVMLLDMTMRGRSSGIDVPFGKFAWVATFRNGLITRAKLYMSQTRALEAVGLSG